MLSSAGTANETASVASLLAEAPTLSLGGICKRYPGSVALDGVDLEIRRGEIHAVVGENGAGKSTLIKIITGLIEHDAGEIRASGVPVTIGTPRSASKLGITSVPQDVLVVPELTIGRNIILGMERAGARRTSLDAREEQTVNKALRQVGANFSPSAPTRALSIPQLRLAQVARALVQPGDILVLDEPTAVLSEPDAEHLLDRLLAFRQEGMAIVYVTHRLSEVVRVADRVTVLRDGKRVGHFRRDAFDRSMLVALMAKNEQGVVATDARRDWLKERPLTERRDSVPALVVRGLCAERRFAAISFSVRKGEIVGIAGVQGSGHGYVLRAIAGVDAHDAGEVRAFGTVVASASIKQSFRAGILLVPADRRQSAIVSSLPIQANLALSPRVSRDCRRFGMRWLKRERAITLRHAERLSINPPRPEALAGNLSGGNQQKVALARALGGDVQILLTEEPTQGIDVQSRAEIHTLLRQIARERDCAIVIASSEFDELIGLADTIHVMRLGMLVATLPGRNVTYQDILHQALP